MEREKTQGLAQEMSSADQSAAEALTRAAMSGEAWRMTWAISEPMPATSGLPPLCCPGVQGRRRRLRPHLLQAARLLMWVCSSFAARSWP